MVSATGHAYETMEPGLPLVGREAERVLLAEQVSAAAAGHGNVVIIGGEAGIGKTTIARDLVVQAAAQGFLALTGHCHDLTATPPYGLWLDLAEHSEHMPDGSALPAVPVLLDRGTLDRIASQSALFADVTRSLREMAEVRPAVIVLEDVHWADPASLELLRYVSARIGHAPVLLVVTYRVDELTRQNPFYHQLPALVRESEGLRLDLQRLTPEALETLISVHYALPDDDRRRLVEHLATHAEGNPFFAMELLRALEEEGDSGLTRTADGWRLADIERFRVPPLVRQVIDARVSRLGEDVREPLTVASVIGHDVPLDLLASIAAQDPDTLFAAIDTAIEWHLCTEIAGGASIRFVHALTREALYASIPSHRRRALHRKVAETLEARPNADPDAVAYHYQQALDPRAPDWLTRAGERAQRAYAWLTARDRFAAAAQLLEATPGAEIARARLLYRCGRLLRYSNAVAAIDYLGTAARLAHEAGDQVLAADATYSRGLVQCFADDWAHGLPAMLSGIETLRSLPPQDTSLTTATAAWTADALPPLEAWPAKPKAAGAGTIVPLGVNRQKSVIWHLAAGGHLAEASRLSDLYGVDGDTMDADALEISNTGHSMLGAAIMLASRGDPDGARTAFGQALRSYEAIGHHACLAFTWLTELTEIAIPYRADDPTERQRLADEGARAIEMARGAFRADVPPALAQLTVMALDGRWREARAIAQSCSHPGIYVLRRQATLALTPIALHTGDTDAAWMHIRSLLPAGVDAEPGSAVLLDALMLQQVGATLCLDAGDFDGAAAWLRANERWLAWSGSVLGRAASEIGWARYHDRAGDPAAAADHAERAVRAATEPRQPLALLQAWRLRGMLAASRGDRAAAEADLVASLDLATACGIPFERAESLVALAELQRDGDLAGEALAIARALEAAPMVNRAERLLAMRASGPASSTYPAGLTTREVEVLRLVAGGLTDAEVADRLSISPRTVGQHLHSVYGKLDVRSRTEATRFAIEHGIA